MNEKKNKGGRRFIPYDLYQHGEYIGRYISPELSEKLGVSRAVLKTLVTTGRVTPDGYEVMRAEPPGWPESWELACNVLRR